MVVGAANAPVPAPRNSLTWASLANATAREALARPDDLPFPLRLGARSLTTPKPAVEHLT